jgi:hypothetical protein
MGSYFYPQIEVPYSPLVIASKNWSPGVSGWRLDETESEFQRIRSRQSIRLGPTGTSLDALGILLNWADHLQWFIQAHSFVWAGASPAFVTFPQAFPSQCWTAVCCFGDSPGLTLAHVGSLQTNGFYWYSGASVGHRLNYIAVGY